MPKFARWDENLASHTPDVQAAASALEAIMREELPGVVEGTGRRIRHIKVRTAEAAASDGVRDAIRAQLAER